MIYLDSCALIKVVRPEKETSALQAFLGKRRDLARVTSELARVEITRTVRRLNHSEHGELVDAERLRVDLARADRSLGLASLLGVSGTVLSDAAVFEQPFLRTLDAIHLASAQRLGNGLTAFVTYDKRLAAAAEDMGLPVVMPT